jgi:lambda family phage tail tape measure protein
MATGAGESLGTARLDLTVDTTGFEAAIARSKSMAEGLGTDAQQAFDKSTGAAKKAGSSLLRYAETIGKSVDEVKLLRAAWQGVDVKVLTAARDRINSVRAATEQAAKAARDLAVAEQAAAQQKIVGESFLTGLQQQAAAINKNKFELMELKAAELNVSSAAQPFINSMREAATAATELAQAEQRAAQQTNFLANLQQTTLAATKTRAEMLELKAAELGVSQQAAPMIAALKKQEMQLVSTGTQFNKYGLSVKQTQAALRQVPAQMTDIFVSLQGGQNPLTVLLQQGGQLKDVFGGIRPAAEALGSALLRLINPYTLLAAAIGGILAVEVSAEKQTNEFHKALILTGEASGQTAESLQRMAESMDSMAGVTTSNAANALAQVVNSGKIAAESIDLVTRAALAMEEATGKAVSTTISEFEQIGRDPVNAILKLDEAEHFLTRTVLDQIEALQEQGDIAAAAALATQARAEAEIQRAAEVTESLGLVTGAWHSIKKASGEAWDSAKQYFVQVDQHAKESWEWLTKLKGAFAGIGTPGGGYGMAAIMRAPDAEGGATTAAKKKIDPLAEERLQAQVLANLSREQKQRREINQIKADGIAAGWSQLKIDKLVAESQARYQESLPKTSNRGADRIESAGNRARLQELKDSLEKEQALIEGQSQILAAQYAARLVTTEDYYAKTRALMQQGQQAEEKSILAQIDVLQQRDVAGAKSIDTIRQIGELEAQLAKVRADGATKLAILGIQENDYYAKRLLSIQSYRDSLEDVSQRMEEQNENAILKLTLGEQEASLQIRINEIYRDQADALRELSRALEAGKIDQSEYDAEVKLRQDATTRQVEIVKKGYEDMKALQGDWLNGLRTGVADWITRTSDVASQVNQITTSSLDKAADALGNFVTTGKLDIKELLRSILAEIAKFMAKQVVLSFIKAFLGSAMGGGDTTAASSEFGSTGWGGLTNYYGAKGAIIGGGQAEFFAKGSAVTNKIFNQPTSFKFAKGGRMRNGVMGEAGDEAVMPLAKGPDGSLGVKMYGGGMSSPVNLTVNTTINAKGDNDKASPSETDQQNAFKQFQGEIKNMCEEHIQRSMRPGGTLWRAGVKGG